MEVSRNQCRVLPCSGIMVWCTLWLLLPAVAGAQFSLTGEYRPRSEMSHGYGTLAGEDQKGSLFTSQRTRLNLLFSSEHIRTGLVLQDVRVWGNQPQLVENQEKAVSLHEGWAEILFTPVFSLKAGRQELNYDDHRIFGNVGWTQQARSHDLFLLKYEKEVKVHLGVAHHENSNRRNNRYDGPDAYKDMQFAWFHKSWKNESLSLLFLNNGVPVISDGEQETRYAQTLGGRLTVKPAAAVSLAANFYYQTGKDNLNRDVNALNLLAELSAKMNPTATATFGYEYLSGNDAGEISENKAFNPLYGTNHKFNGFMDYFYVGGQHINGPGLNDIYFKWACSRFKKVQWNLHIHYFGAAAALPGAARKYLGTEVDWDLTWTVNPAAKISLGYSHMFAGESMELVKPGGDHQSTQNWAYLMFSVTPAFLK